MFRELGNKTNINYGIIAEKAIVSDMKNRTGDYLLDVESYPFGKYDVDLKFVFKDGSFLYADIERRANWVSNWEYFPFETINIPYRKLKMIQTRTPFIYFILREDCKRGLILSGVDILDGEKVISANKFSKNDEPFLAVFIEKIIKYIDLETGE